ncbi:vWA domain-containing protein [Ruminiclostridium cellobioparum]|uniref:von Willebrand factor type A domain protein n=1 Tax=Ruminiclostridium cellobioparum subsp. termitidis CT1112 TaxID=1195236 RepID=S0FNB1_RUMCE|nr:von Willebrand factor type A domain-containing protein [Ruminiclostridium cellobioparum]EMS73735.1 von Willebrand factor type A domain protein [Ruminiclostridium cellobioparum subsp. termitidis CT1112]
MKSLLNGMRRSGTLWLLLILICTVLLGSCGNSNRADTAEATAGNNNETLNGYIRPSEDTYSIDEDSGNIRDGGSQTADNVTESGKAVQSQDKKYRGTYFKDYGVNPFKDVMEQPQSTFSLDVDTASYSIARKYINSGSLPPKDAIRVEEFINYFNRDYPVSSGDTFSIFTEMAPSAFNRGYHVLEVGIQGKEVSAANLKRTALTFVIDVSGSMGMDNRLTLVKKSLKILVDQMGKNDKIGIVIYGTNGRKLLEPTSGDDKKRILGAIDKLEPEGSTNAAEGLILGYDMAYNSFMENGNNRIILCTDGVANQGITKAEDILKMVEDYKAKGITLTTLGFGMDNFNDIFLETLADKGDGNYAYIDTLDEAGKVFIDQLAGTLEVIAKDAKAQIEFDKNSIESYRLIGYENRALEDKDFRNNSVDAGEIGAGHAVTALYEVKLKNSVQEYIGTVKLRYKNPDTDRVTEISKNIKSSLIRDSFYNATPRFKFITMVAQTAEILKGSSWASNTSLEDVYKVLKDEMGDMDLNKEDSEFVDLIRTAVEIKGRD